MKRSVLALVALLVGATSVLAQTTPIPVQLAPTPAAALTCANNNLAVSNTVTLTITPPSGMYVYIAEIDAQHSVDGTGGNAEANFKYTSTNLNSTSGGLWSAQYSAAGTANTSQAVGPYLFLQPLKSAQPGIAVTIVSPAVDSHGTYNINACYYFAP